MSPRPVVLLASERSGSNLLRSMLGRHSLVCAPPPAGHVLRVLGPLLHLYAGADGRLRIDELVADAVALTRAHGQPWEIDLDPRRVRARLKADTLWEVFRVLYDLHAEADGCPVWLAKDSRQFEWAYPLRAALPEARFLYLARDGRDVACSALRSPGHDQHVYTCARRWRDDQARCLAFRADPAGGRDATLSLRYEDLLAEPEANLERVCGFLELRFERGMLEFHRGQEARAAAGRARDWQNLARPLLRDNAGGYRRQLRPRQVRLFERIAGRELEQLGYRRDFPAEPVVADLRLARRLACELLDALRRRRRGRRWLEREPFRAERQRLVQAIRRRLRGGRGAGEAAP